MKRTFGMTIRNLFKPAPAPRTRPSAKAGQRPEQANDLQVDDSHTQWRHAQMEQLERSYLAACDAVESPAAA